MLATGTFAPAAFAEERASSVSDLHATSLTVAANGTNTTMATAQEITLGQLVTGELTYTKDRAQTFWDSYWYKFKTGADDVAYSFLFESVADNYMNATIYDSNGNWKKHLTVKSTPATYLGASFSKNSWYYVQVAHSSPGTSSSKGLGYHLTVNAKAVDISKATVTLDQNSYVYDGSTKKPGVTVSLGGDTLGSSDYSVSYSDNTKPGTATVTVNGKGDYKGTKTATFKINKANNAMKASGKKVTLKSGAKKLMKNKTVAKAKAFNVSKANGSVKFAKSSGNKKITVSKKGSVKVKKGLKNGTYKVKVNVTASGDAYHKASTKTVTLTVKVKR